MMESDITNTPEESVRVSLGRAHRDGVISNNIEICYSQAFRPPSPETTDGEEQGRINNHNRVLIITMHYPRHRKRHVCESF